ncbi:MAG TPA: carboxypeptidase-like regulatory domain-containing protein, partial [Thermoanaerobaculia bacterium]|nr:carboxypeptidase-like regulatory domain-containing protein [Thermoanaerobaculia bacterium]
MFQSALAQDQWRLIYQDGSVESVWGVPQPGAEKLARLQYAWVWSEIRAPRRVEAKGLGKPSPGGADAARLAIRIVRPQGSRPAAGARVIAAPLAMWNDLPEDLLPSWPVPADGRLSIPLDAGQRWRLRVAGPTAGSWWVDVPPGQRSALLAPVAATGGRTQVIDAQGAAVAPVNGAILEGRSRQGGNRFWAALRGEAGRLELPGLPDQEEITFTVTKPGYSPALWRGVPSALPPRLQLSAGAILTGRTVDPGGKAIPEAAIEVESWASPQVPQLYRMKARGQKDGTWTLAGVLPGTVFLSVRAPGFAPFGQQMEAPPGTTDLGAVTLTPGRTVTVLAVDDLGQPVAGASIEAGPGLSAKADSEGVARLAGVSPAAPLKLIAGADRHLPGKAQANPPLPEEMRIELPRAFTIQGRFLEAPGTPAAGGLVRTEQASCQKEHRADEGGRFEMALPPGEAITLALRSPRTPELRLPLAAGTAGEVRDLGDLAPPPSLAVAGRVVRASDGLPVAGARVWMPRPGPGGAIFSWAGRDLVETSTGEDGRFRLTGLAPGPALLRVEAAGLARAHLNLSLGSDATDEAVDVGIVSLAAGATLRVLVAGPPPGLAVARADLRGNWSEADMLMAAVQEGVATFRNVPPGKVTVSVRTGRKLLCERDLEVPETEGSLDVDCARAALRVAGVVLVGGAPAG